MPAPFPRPTMNERSNGHIEVIAGCMFSGKSEELIRRLRRAEIARQRVQIFKPASDTRSVGVQSRDNRSLVAIGVPSSRLLREEVKVGTQVVGIDEAQFFDEGLVAVCTELADLGLRVIVAGLDMDFRGEPFGPMPALLAVAEYADKLHAICVRCGAPALYSHRIVGGQEQVLVGDAESYEARCRRCFQRESSEESQTALDLEPATAGVGDG